MTINTTANQIKDPPAQNSRGWWMGLAWSILAMSSAQGEEVTSISFDWPIQQGHRIEFYRQDDFGAAGDACHACLSPHHVNCPVACYRDIKSLSLICSPSTRGISLGPYTRADRNTMMNALLASERVIFANAFAEESIEIPKISSQTGDSEDQYAIDLEGLEGLKNALERATAHELDQFSIRIGTEILTVPLQPRARSAFFSFLKQCPDG